jgi:hypothetical protein
MTRHLTFSLCAAAWLAGCATSEPPGSAGIPERSPDAKPALRNDTLKHLANRNLTPIVTRPLNAKAGCSFRDPDGYRGSLQLDVRQASVKRFEASVSVPKQGDCNFKLKDFEQTQSAPIVMLAARQTSCKVSLWEQGEQVTVAFRDCRAECSGNSVDYLWPILVDNRKGSCS